MEIVSFSTRNVRLRSRFFSYVENRPGICLLSERDEELSRSANAWLFSMVSERVKGTKFLSVVLLTLVIVLTGCDSSAEKQEQEQVESIQKAKHKAEVNRNRLAENANNPLADIWNKDPGK